ncbi:MAG: hypothetical protein RSD67_02420 [Oscillospiraceae bacterium]
MERRENESYLQYAKRLTIAVEDNLISYNEYGDYLLGEQNTYSSENLRKAFYVISKMFKMIDTDIKYDDVEFAKEIEQLKFELLKERKKLQTVNLEYHQNARAEGRFELFLELIETAINNLRPIVIKPTVYKENVDTETTGVLFISDAHYGRDVQLNGLFGEVINSYDTKEFENRMWSLLSQVDNDSFEISYDKLDIIDCGDNIEGILRLGDSLTSLKTGVIQSAMQYAEFMATWVIEAHNRLGVPVTYKLTGGNHDTLRLLGSKPCFQNENIAKFICEHIRLRIENSKLQSQLDTGDLPKIKVCEYNDVLYQNYYGINLVAYHGDTKNMKEDIEFFENFYQIDIDILVGGHLHRNSSETIGVGYMGDRELIRLPSICGNDTFSKNIRRLSRAGATFMTFSKNGKGWGKPYYLN